MLTHGGRGGHLWKSSDLGHSASLLLTWTSVILTLSTNGMQHYCRSNMDRWHLHMRLQVCAHIKAISHFSPVVPNGHCWTIIMQLPAWSWWSPSLCSWTSCICLCRCWCGWWVGQHNLLLSLHHALQRFSFGFRTMATWCCRRWEPSPTHNSRCFSGLTRQDWSTPHCTTHLELYTSTQAEVKARKSRWTEAFLLGGCGLWWDSSARLEEKLMRVRRFPCMQLWWMIINPVEGPPQVSQAQMHCLWRWSLLLFFFLNHFLSPSCGSNLICKKAWLLRFQSILVHPGGSFIASCVASTLSFRCQNPKGMKIEKQIEAERRSNKSWWYFRASEWNHLMSLVMFSD